MRIEPLSPLHAERYRALMLEAYERCAEAFTSAVAERAALPLSWWESRVADARGTSVAFGAFLDDVLVGAAGLQLEIREKTRHKATLFGVYVSDAHRGRGAGRKLVGAALEYARARATTVVQLTVTEGNASAQALYESCGFRVFGVEPRAMRMHGAYLAKVHMWCDLSAATGANAPSPGHRVTGSERT
jgi:ribosomal protein S18 acetylase RimI-like enzyme